VDAVDVQSEMMKNKFHYSAAGFQEPVDINVMSLEQKSAVGNLIKWDETGNVYRVIECRDPFESELEAGSAAIEGSITMKVELVGRGPGYPVCPIHNSKMERTSQMDLPKLQRFYYCPESGCKQRYSFETGHITTDDIPSSRPPQG
jgi:hypothetical protein